MSGEGPQRQRKAAPKPPGLNAKSVLDVARTQAFLHANSWSLTVPFRWKEVLENARMLWEGAHQASSPTPPHLSSFVSISLTKFRRQLPIKPTMQESYVPFTCTSPLTADRSKSASPCATSGTRSRCPHCSGSSSAWARKPGSTPSGACSTQPLAACTRTTCCSSSRRRTSLPRGLMPRAPCAISATTATSWSTSWMGPS